MEEAYKNNYAESVLSAINDLETGNVFHKDLSGRRVAWYEALGIMLNNYRDRLDGVDVKIPSIRECLELWCDDKLKKQNLYLPHPQLSIIQQKLNQSIQAFLDNVYFYGDAYLLSFMMVRNPKPFFSLAIVAGVATSTKNEFHKEIIQKKAQNLYNELLTLIDRDYPANGSKSTVFNRELREYKRMQKSIKKAFV